MSKPESPIPGGFVLSKEEWDELRTAFRWTGGGLLRSASVEEHVAKLFEMISERTGCCFEQYT